MTENKHAELDAFIDSLKLEYNVVFIPQSVSRNAGQTDRSLNWMISIRANGVVLSTEYMQGIGHLPIPNSMKTIPRNRVIRHDWEKKAVESGKCGEYHQTMIPAPKIRDVLYSVVLDSDAADETFDDWCWNTGFDNDSRSAERTYNACRENGLLLRKMIGADAVAKFRELFQDY